MARFATFHATYRHSGEDSMPAHSASPLPNFRLIRYVSIAAFFLAVHVAAAQDYTITKLPQSTDPVAVNSSGQVAGNINQTGNGTAFIWTRTAGLKVLGDLGGGLSGAHAMNDSGTVVGVSN